MIEYQYTRTEKRVIRTQRDDAAGEEESLTQKAPESVSHQLTGLAIMEMPAYSLSFPAERLTYQLTEVWLFPSTDRLD